MTASGTLRVTAAFLAVAGAWAAAADNAWDLRLARALSPRLRAIEAELPGILSNLETLPAIPVADQGGTGGFAGVAPAPDGKHPGSGIEIRWAKPAAVDCVALVPARRYDAAGLDPQYGLPLDFTVELLDATGAVVARVAEQRDTRADPVRRGHPFCYNVSPPVEASGLRVTATRPLPDPDNPGMFLHAWSEVFVFAQGTNIALGAGTEPFGCSQPPSPWHWRPAFATDGETPLGLPELPDGEHGNIGWISEGRPKATDAAAITVNLGAQATLDAVRLFPAKRPTADLPSGFGFPRKYTVSLSATGLPGDWTSAASVDMENPGFNPVLTRFPAAQGRFLKIEATVLWKAFDDYPAFFALSEIEVLHDQDNLALGKSAYSPDGMSNVIASTGRVWSSAALCDGHGPDGKLVSTREWLAALDRRLALETCRYRLEGEAGRIIAGWRHTAQTALVALGLAATLLAIVLPLRYRRHARRELVKVRERIAGDLHDEVGSNLGSIQMLADLATTRSGQSEELKRIQRIAGETVSSVRDIVWLLRPEGEHRIGTVEHLRETASILLETVDWKFTADEAAWQAELPDAETRHLFLFFREALHNIIRHARAAKVEIRVEAASGRLCLHIADDGAGIPPERLARPATLHALHQRAEALRATLEVTSEPGAGTRLDLSVPMGKTNASGSR